MKDKIEQYITEITVDKDWNLDSNFDYKETSRLRYSGDGQGDFEEAAYDTTDQCLRNYVLYCQDQISFAKDELNKRKLSRYNEDTKTLENYYEANK